MSIKSRLARPLAFGLLLALVACGRPHRDAPLAPEFDPGAVIEAEQPGEQPLAQLTLVGGEDRWPTEELAALEPEHTGSIDRRGAWSQADVSRILDAARVENTNVLVRLVPEHDRSDLEAIEGVEVEGELGFDSGVYAITYPPEAQERIAAELAALDAADVVGVNHLFRLSRNPNDTLFAQQRNMTAPEANAVGAWNQLTDGSGVLVAVVDDILPTVQHPDLDGNIAPGGKAFITGTDGGHGTHVAGIIGAVGNNGQGVAGVCWRARILPVRALTAQGGTLLTVAQSVYYAVNQGAKIINMSLEGTSSNKVLFDAMAYAQAKGVLVVVAAGNSAQFIDISFLAVYPASYTFDNIITVAAVDSRGWLASFSNYGATSVDIAAPGVGILSTFPGNRYAYMSGTSQATPMVAGAAALVWSRNPSMTYKQVRSRLLDTAKGMSTIARTASGGVLDVDAALKGVKAPLF